ncbi:MULTISPECIES: hypothetical protein [Lactobacillaceae]|uniref:hypothetical protein n=1 Tax=Lactobacillaceae TaxID=33958 RepID=UPI0010944761|nr:MULTISPECIES: hypothetical protein [Lactobacillaceae]TGY64314.1 hypothetical protein E5337_02005 [Limosilactobacillus reuteri]
MTTSMVHSRSMLAKVIAESPSPFIIPIFCINVIKIIFLSINYFIKRMEKARRAIKKPILIILLS